MNDPPMMEAMPPAPVSGDVDSGEEQESRVPTWGDYAAQQSVNAQLAEKVAELTKATHLLWREERTLRRRSHHQILKLKKQCCQCRSRMQLLGITATGFTVTQWSLILQS